MSTITAPELALWHRHAFDCQLLDVRRESARLADGDEIEGSLWLDPASWLDWKDGVATRRSCTAPTATRSARA